LVTQFTGVIFEEGTSVGTGNVLELYMNFGMAGVVAGFALLGFILMRLDQGVMRALATGNIHGMLQRALPGLALLHPLESFLEMLVATISAIVVAQLLIRSGLLVPPFIKRPNVKLSGPTTRTIVRRWPDEFVSR
jgi:thiamine transporter ThiT